MINEQPAFIQGSSSKKRQAPELDNAGELAGDDDNSQPPAKRAKRSAAVLASSKSAKQLAKSPANPKKRKNPEDSDNDLSEDNFEVKPPTKRKRVSRVKPAAASQLDKGILSLPIELKCVICYELRSIDLLSLSLVCSAFSSLLHGPSSAMIWSTVRVQNGIPDFPAMLNISEQRFADLAFGESCHLCNKRAKSGMTMKRRIIWGAGIAVCEPCNKKSLVSSSELRFPTFPAPLLKIIPTTDSVNQRGARFLHTMATDLLKEYNAQPSADMKKRWLIKKTDEHVTLNKACCECIEWHSKYKSKVVDDRIAAVLQELRRLGWSEEISSMGSKYENPIADDKKLRTKCQREISESVLQELIDHLVPSLEVERELRLSKIREAMLEKRLKVLRKFHKSCVSQLPRNALVPSSADLFMHPLVRGIIEDTPNDGSKFTIAHLDPVKDSFLEISRQWVDEVKSKLFTMVQSSLRSDGNSQEQPDQRDIDTSLSLATTFFHCSGCSRDYYRDSHETSFRYQRAIIHACAGEWSSQTECPEPLETLRENLKKLPWNTSNDISFSSRAHRIMRDIVALCGLDPDTTTAKEMNVIDPIFECVTCNSPSNGRCTMTWECIIRHHGANGPHGKPTKTRQPTEANFVLLDEGEASVVRQRMAEVLARERAVNGYKGLYCSVCRVTGNSVDLADASHGCGSEGKAVPYLDRRQYPVEYWLWPPRNHAPLDIGSTSDTESDTALDIMSESNLEEGGEDFNYEKGDTFVNFGQAEDSDDGAW